MAGQEISRRLTVTRRTALIGAGAALVTGCTEEIAIVDPVTTALITITEVKVDGSGLPLWAGVVDTGRDTILSREQIATDVQRSIEAAIAERGFSGAHEATLSIALTRVRLTSLGGAFALRGRSSIEGDVSLTASDGTELMPPQPVQGHSGRIRYGGLVAVALSPAPDTDYAQTVAGFADSVLRRIFDGGQVDLRGALVG